MRDKTERRSNTGPDINSQERDLDSSTLTPPAASSNEETGHNKAIEELEALLLQRPRDTRAVRTLVTILDRYLPGEGGLGPYSDCQRRLNTRFGADTWIDDVVDPGKAAEHYRQWQQFLDSNCAMPPIAIAQIFDGTDFTINGVNTDCDLRLSLFEKTKVISRFCHDCYKVQVLPSDLKSLMAIHFLFRKIELPRDNFRKCMIELRENVPYPYKAYIFCESEDEVRACFETLRTGMQGAGLTDQRCGISHGCSEYGLEYPAFKFSDDGAHRSFERPAAWDEVESAFWTATPRPNAPATGRKKAGLSLRDLIGYRTWIDYAELIGDESWSLFRDAPSTNMPKFFVERVKKQAQRRNAQMNELRKTSSSA